MSFPKLQRLLPYVLFASIVGCSGGLTGAPSESMALAFIQSQNVAAIKTGILKIDSFEKTNGIKSTEGGTEQYTLEYKMELSFPKGSMPECVDTAHFNMNCYNARLHGAQFKKVGAHETELGKVLFEKTENGWRATEYGADNAGL